MTQLELFNLNNKIRYNLKKIDDLIKNDLYDMANELTETYYQLGELYYKINNFSSSIYYFLKSIEIDKYICCYANLIDSYEYIAYCYKHLGAYDKALFYYNKVVSYYEDYEDYNVYDHYSTIAVLYAYEKKFVEAHNYINKANLDLEDKGINCQHSIYYNNKNVSSINVEYALIDKKSVVANNDNIYEILGDYFYREGKISDLEGNYIYAKECYVNAIFNYKVLYNAFYNEPLDDNAEEYKERINKKIKKVNYNLFKINGGKRYYGPKKSYY